MHPFTGLALLLPVSLLSMRLNALGGLLGLLAVSLLLLLSRPQGWKGLRHWCLVLTPLAFGLLLVHGQWIDEWSGHVVANREAALLLALRLWLRVAIVLAGAMLWLSTAPPEQLTRALLASRLPPGVAYLLASPVLLVEQLKARLAAIAEAQATRGVDMHAPWFKRWRNVLTLSLPLVIWTLSDVNERAAALDARAFRSRSRRTTVNAPPLASWERPLRALALLGALLIGASFLWR